MNAVPAVLHMHISCNGTANCTVGHDCEALFFWRQNAFNDNYVKKLLFPFQVPQGIKNK